LDEHTNPKVIGESLCVFEKVRAWGVVPKGTLDFAAWVIKGLTSLVIGYRSYGTYLGWNPELKSKIRVHI